MQSPKTKALRSEQGPMIKELEAQISELQDLIKGYNSKLRSAVLRDSKLLTPFHRGIAYQISGLSDDGECSYDIRVVRLIFVDGYDWMLVTGLKIHSLEGSKELSLEAVVEQATERLRELGYRFIPCTWLDDNHVEVHWPEDLL